MKKPIEWLKVKADYLKGITPKELGLKYGLTAKQISDKASHENWVLKKSEISERLETNFEQDIKELTELSFKALKDVLTISDDFKDKIAASRVVMDVSGLKNSKTDVNINTFKRFVESLED